MFNFQSLLDRNVGVNVGSHSGVSTHSGVGGWGEEEERKPRPIGTERAWKLTAADDWPHHMHHQHLPDHDRYQVTTAALMDVNHLSVTRFSMNLFLIK